MYSLLDDLNDSVQNLLHEGMDMIKTRNKLSVINDIHDYKTGQTYAKGVSGQNPPGQNPPRTKSPGQNPPGQNPP